MERKLALQEAEMSLQDRQIQELTAALAALQASLPRTGSSQAPIMPATQSLAPAAHQPTAVPVRQPGTEAPQLPPATYPVPKPCLPPPERICQRSTMDRAYNSTEHSLYLTNSWPGVSVYRETATMRGDPWPEQVGGVDNDSVLYAGINVTGRNETLTQRRPYDPLGGHTIWQVALIGLFSCLLSLVTIVGNILVLVAFKVNKQLKTVNNYFLLSLAFADLIIGVISMNLYTAYIIMDQWAMGAWACDLWLAIDYVASNASVMNLLVISFDRYFSITRPLTYRAKRTTKRAGLMIGLAWAVSVVLWAPAILFWQYFVGERNVPPDKCYVQFLTVPIITFCTAIAAFYLPVTIMSVLYWRIYKETQNRARELAGLQALGSEGGEGGSSRSCGSCDRSEGLRFGSSVRRAGAAVGRFPFWLAERARRPGGSEEADRTSCDSWNNNDAAVCIDQSASSDEEEIPETRAIFSIVLNLPGIRPPGMPVGMAMADELNASEEDPLRGRDKGGGVVDGDGVENDTYHQRFPSKIQAMPPVQTPDAAGEVFTPTGKSAPMSFKDAALARRFAARTRTQITKRKRMSLVKEKKAAQTLSAILFAFIITWTPYNIMVLVNTFCSNCIPQTLWSLGYWLCYVNSTVNPMCYALCNKTFRTTFKLILLCRWNSRQRRKQLFLQRHSVTFRRNTTGDST